MHWTPGQIKTPLTEGIQGHESLVDNSWCGGEHCCLNWTLSQHLHLTEKEMRFAKWRYLGTLSLISFLQITPEELLVFHMSVKETVQKSLCRQTKRFWKCILLTWTLESSADNNSPPTHSRTCPSTFFFRTLNKQMRSDFQYFCLVDDKKTFRWKINM